MACGLPMPCCSTSPSWVTWVLCSHVDPAQGSSTWCCSTRLPCVHKFLPWMQQQFLFDKTSLWSADIRLVFTLPVACKTPGTTSYSLLPSLNKGSSGKCFNAKSRCKQNHLSGGGAQFRGPAAFHEHFFFWQPSFWVVTSTEGPELQAKLTDSTPSSRQTVASWY